jgi:hypothetical protein
MTNIDSEDIISSAGIATGPQKVLKILYERTFITKLSPGKNS